MDIKQENFLDVLKRNNEEDIKSFISQNGKPKKPICPIYFWTEEDKEGEMYDGE